MSRKEVPRAGLLKAALAGRISNAQGAEALTLSVRQFQRLKGRYRADGAAGLVHRLRGRPAARRLPADVRRAVATLLETTYAGLNDCHATEKLREVEGLMVSRSSVRRLRRALGLPAKRQRRARQARRRREPAAQMGALVQVDGSEFAWFENRGPVLTLHGAIDDATGAILALQLRPHEDLHGYVALLHELITTSGVPLALYGDGLNVFARNDQHWTLAEQLQGAQDPTHFGRILRDLAIGFITARSAQAKGRIERLWQTLQDRLVSELRLRGITTLEAAQAFLPEFRADYNRRFTRVPADAHPRVAPRSTGSGRPPELPLPARRRARQHRPPRAPLGAAAAAPRLHRAPPGAARVSRWTAARLRRRRLRREPARPRRRRSSSGHAGARAPTGTRAAAPLSAPRPRGAATPLPAQTAQLRLPHARVRRRAARRPRRAGGPVAPTRGATLTRSPSATRDDILSEQFR